MSLAVAVLLPLALVVLGLIGVALLILAVVSPERTGLDRRHLAIRWTGIALGLLAALLLVSSDQLPGRLGLGALAGTAPLVGAGALIAVVLLGERFMSGPLGSVRRATLQPHGPVEVLPRIVTAFAGVMVLGLGALMVVTTSLASPDDQGRPGRALTVTAADAGDGSLLSSTVGPYPGSWTTVPAGAALLLLVLLAGLALHGIVSRRSAADPADLLLRRRSATAVLGAVMLGTGALAVVLSAVALLMQSMVPADYPAATVLMVVVLVLGLIAIPWGLVLVLAPSLLAVRGQGRAA